MEGNLPQGGIIQGGTSFGGFDLPIRVQHQAQHPHTMHQHQTHPRQGSSVHSTVHDGFPLTMGTMQNCDQTISLADIGGAFVMFGITYFVGSYFSEGSDQFDFKYLGKKLLQSVPLVTYIVMFILNISHIHLPHVAIDFFSILSHANMPLSMILLGVMLNFTLERKYIPAIFTVLQISIYVAR